MLRDEFAKAAMNGLVSRLNGGRAYDLDLVAKQAYEIADAMVRQSTVPYKTMEEIASEYMALKNNTQNDAGPAAGSDGSHSEDTRVRASAVPTGNTQESGSELFSQCQYMIEWLKAQVLEREATIAELRGRLEHTKDA